MRRIRWVALCLAAAAMPALAEFEGVLEMKMTMRGGGTGTGKTYVSKAGWRSEMLMQIFRMQKAGQQSTDVPPARAADANGSMKMTMLGKMSEPDKIYHVDDERRTYSVTDLNKARETAGKRDEETYTIKKLGPDSVAGFACEKVLVTSSKGNEFEACAAKDIFGSSAWLSAMQQHGRGGAYGGWARALKEAGVGQFLIRMVMHDKATKEETMRMELVRADRKSVPSSLFEIPPGYTEQDPMNAGMGHMSPEQQEKMRKAMENLTPEQRKMMEDAMKARGQRGNN